MFWAQVFFFVSVLGLAGALNALRSMAPGKHPVRRPLWIPMLITAELVPLRVLSRAIFGGLFIWAGALDFRAGRIALWLTLATWAVYVLLLRRSFATRRSLATTLSNAAIAMSEPYIDWRRVLPAWPWRVPSDVDRVDDVEYAPDLHLDLYRPASATLTKAPILLQVHGGGWRGGNRRQQARPLMDRLAASGWLFL